MKVSLRTAMRAGATALVLVLTTLVASGCITPTVYGGVGAALRELHLQRQAFKEQFHQDYAQYQKEFETAGCPKEEYELNPKVLEFIEYSPPITDGYREAQKILLDIYQDETVAKKIRAHALYHAALAEIGRKDGKRERARELLNQLKEEFPGTHDCAVETLLDETGPI